MNSPAKSRFMGITYLIGYPEAVADGERYGETDHIARQIAVEDSLPHDHKREIVLHEIIHQMCSTAELGFEEETEERIATFFGRALVGHMRDNPTLWRWILQKPPKEINAETQPE